jgi:hypothetical protein
VSLVRACRAPFAANQNLEITIAFKTTTATMSGAGQQMELEAMADMFNKYASLVVRPKSRATRARTRACAR